MKMAILARKSRNICHYKADNIVFMLRKKVVGAFFKPNCIRKNWYSPCRVMMAVLSRSVGSISVCQLPLFVSKVEGTCASYKESAYSSACRRLARSLWFVSPLLHPSPANSKFSIFESTPPSVYLLTV